MLKGIHFDTTGKGENGKYICEKYPYNKELWDIIVPNIIYMQNSLDLYEHKEINWGSYEIMCRDSNGHCIYLSDGSGYIASPEFDFIWFKSEFITSYIDNECKYINSLTDLIEQIVKKEKINYDLPC